MTIENLRLAILNCFASINATERQALGIRDFNSQIMSRTFESADRDALGTTLQALVDEGLLVAQSPTTYSLTAVGVVAAGEAKTALAQAIAARPRR
jgi:hypothetical protein